MIIGTLNKDSAKTYFENDGKCCPYCGGRDCNSVNDCFICLSCRKMWTVTSEVQFITDEVGNTFERYNDKDCIAIIDIMNMCKACWTSIILEKKVKLDSSKIMEIYNKLKE